MIKKKQMAILLVSAALMMQPVNTAKAMTSSDMKKKITAGKTEVKKLNKKIKSIKIKIKKEKQELEYLENMIGQYIYEYELAHQEVEENVYSTYPEGGHNKLKSISFIANVKYLSPVSSESSEVPASNRFSEYQKTIDRLNNQKEDLEDKIEDFKKDLKDHQKKKDKLAVTIQANKTKLKKLLKNEFNGVTLQYSAAYKIRTKKLTKKGGTIRFNGHKETYYSQKVLAGGGLKIPGRHVADDGTVRDKDGYICVAASASFKKKGEKLMTTLGPAKVYDRGCPHGTIDVYVDW